MKNIEEKTEKHQIGRLARRLGPLLVIEESYLSGEGDSNSSGSCLAAELVDDSSSHTCHHDILNPNEIFL